MTKNKGYTLIEFIIVIAIMAVLTGMSFITINVIRRARCEAATNTFNNQISSCLIRTKATSEASNVSDKPLCMVIKKRTDGAYAIMTGYISGGSVYASTSNAALTPDDNDSCEAVLPKDICRIAYNPASGQGFSNSDMVIQFIKSDGSTLYGGGTYEIYRKNVGGESLYATIYLDPMSGKHFIK